MTTTERPPPGGLLVYASFQTVRIFLRVVMLFLGVTTAAYVKLAMQAFTQNKQGDAVHVEVITASRAPAQSSKGGGYDQENQPDAEYRSHGLVGG